MVAMAGEEWEGKVDIRCRSGALFAVEGLVVARSWERTSSVFCRAERGYDFVVVIRATVGRGG